ncbi:MAG: NAD(P)-dependent oxidoreductase [Planctomycetota bacterium]
MKPKVLITERLDDDCAVWLAERAEVEWVAHDDPDAMAGALPEAEGMVVRTYTQVDAAMLAQAPKLRVVGRAGVGLDNFDLPACAAAGVEVVYTPDANTQAVVEYVTGLMLDHVRPRAALPAGATAEAFHALRQTEVGTQLDEMTLGILGFGRIGKRLGAVAHAVGMNLKVCDLLPEAELRQAVDFPFDCVTHDELYAGSDILSIHVDGRLENREMIDAAALAAMRDEVLLINAARGMLVDHEALVAWAADRSGVRVLLDVHHPEPPAADSPLHGSANITLLPHLASRTAMALKNMSWVVRDVAGVLAGDPPCYPAHVR